MTGQPAVIVPAIPQISAAAQQLVQLFRSIDVGATVTYETMSAAAGVDVRARRHVITTARNRVLVDDSVHIVAVYGVGMRRVSQQEAADTLPSYLTKARNAARKGRRVASKINVLEVPRDKRPAFVAQATLCELIGKTTTAKSQAKLAAAATTQPENTATLAAKQALDALRSGE